MEAAEAAVGSLTANATSWWCVPQPFASPGQLQWDATTAQLGAHWPDSAPTVAVPPLQRRLGTGSSPASASQLSLPLRAGGHHG